MGAVFGVIFRSLCDVLRGDRESVQQAALETSFLWTCRRETF